MTADSRPIDVTAWIGGYPYREVPHPDPEILVRVLDREGFSGAWVGHLPGAFHRDPVPSNRALFKALAPFRERLHPAPIVRPDWPGWEHQLAEAQNEGAPAVRVYPGQWGLGPNHTALAELAHACKQSALVMHVTTKFEDLRQRHAIDGAADVSAATVRGIARHAKTTLLIAGAGRELIEETHWGLTPDEQSRVFYDAHWLWGPPEDHFEHLVNTLGAERLAVSTWWPMRLSQQIHALIDLLPDTEKPHKTFAEFADGHTLSAFAKNNT